MAMKDYTVIMNGLKKCGIEDESAVNIIPLFGDRYIVCVDNEQYGIWDSRRKTFVD